MRRIFAAAAYVLTAVFPLSSIAWAQTTTGPVLDLRTALTSTVTEPTRIDIDEDIYSNGLLAFAVHVHTNDSITLQAPSGVVNVEGVAYFTSLTSSTLTITTIYGIDQNAGGPLFQITGVNPTTPEFVPLSGETIIGASGALYTSTFASVTPISGLAALLGTGFDLSPFAGGDPNSNVYVFKTKVPAADVVPVNRNPVTTDAPFQVRYASNTNVGESYINITNDGANGSPFLGPGFGNQTGNICVNVYAFSPDEQMISCCSCLVTPNGMVNLGVNRDLTAKTLTGVVPTSVVVKLVATLAGLEGTGTNCTNNAATVTTSTAVSGMVAWGTTNHATPSETYAPTETPFSPATLSLGELASLAGRCASILGNGSGFGICSSCQAGALGSVTRN